MSDDLTMFVNARLDEDERELVKDPPAGLGYANLAAHMRREVAAKRAILAEHAYSCCVKDTCCGEIAATYDAESGDPCPTLRSLGSMWGDHPGYRPEWAPSGEAVNPA